MRIIQEKEEEIEKFKGELVQLQVKLWQEQRMCRDREEQQRAGMEESLRQLRWQFEEQKEKDAKTHEGKVRQNMEYLKQMHEKEKDLLKREAELAARKQAEKEFNEALNRKVEEAKTEGHDEGYRKGHDDGKKEVQAERTLPGKILDATVNGLCSYIHKKTSINIDLKMTDKL